MNDELLELEVTLLANARSETIGGREFVVATAVILREQVLNGSDGPLFYPLSEINQDIGVWNGYPLVAPHPWTLNEKGEKVHVSARSPQVANRFQVGVVYNDRMEGTQRLVDAYFDVQNANRIDPRIIPAVLAGKPINVSTGIFTGKLVENNEYGGKKYTHRVKGIKPDHLAVLMNEKGACSVTDGCGINVNASKMSSEVAQLTGSTAFKSQMLDDGLHHHFSTANPERAARTLAKEYPGAKVESEKGLWTVMVMMDGKEHMFHFLPTGTPTVNKEAYITWLTTNCSCWKGDKAKETLNALDEEQLKGLKSNAEKAAKADHVTNVLALTTNKLKESGLEVTDIAQLPDLLTNMSMDECKAWHDKMMKGSKTTMNADKKEEPTPLTREHVVNALKGMKQEEVLDLFPALKQTVNAANDVVEKERITVINKLTEQFTDPEERKAKLLKLKDKSLPVLNEMLEFAVANGKKDEPKDDNERFLANFFGAGGTDPKGTSGRARPTSDPSRILVPAPVVNFEDE